MLRIRRFCLIFAILLCLVSCCLKTPAFNLEKTTFTISGEPWPEADRLFRGNDHWLGGDGASSIDLGSGRVLWLFGDSFINQASSGDRRDAAIIRNSIAIQEGYNPSTASVKFYWHTKDGKPSSFFAEGASHWYWPGDGIRINDTLVIFLMDVCEGKNELGFDVTGWSAVMINNPDADPKEWHIDQVDTPTNQFGVIAGSACVLRIDNYVYAFSADSKNRDAYLLRWPVPSVSKGDLSRPQWWTKERGWIFQEDLAEIPPPLFTEGQMEFTVNYAPAIGKYLQVQTASLLNPSLAYRWAENITGPWSPLKEFYGPAEVGQGNIMVYAGKSHPVLTGAGVVFTYAVNSTESERLLRDTSIYYPVFLKGEIKTVREK
ncbi:MAG: DUF4185 domain-containing protein [Thermodesulfobacteriota bacterium]|nr:DUF4185 domain-containing protein [Thermodesulfobacteriota bacterium]